MKKSEERKEKNYVLKNYCGYKKKRRIAKNLINFLILLQNLNKAKQNICSLTQFEIRNNLKVNKDLCELEVFNWS